LPEEEAEAEAEAGVVYPTKERTRAEAEAEAVKPGRLIARAAALAGTIRGKVVVVARYLSPALAVREPDGTTKATLA
jgi:hypothetical protein